MKKSIAVAIFLSTVIGSNSIRGAESLWVEKAKAEKELLVYGTMPIPDMQEMFRNFEKRYPFIKANQYRSGADKLAQRIATEVKAGRHLADVYLIAGAEMFLLKRQGFISRYESPERKLIRDIYKDKDGYWTGAYANIELIGYNKNLVAASEAPRSHQDLLDPKWKGKIGMDPTDIEWYMIQIHLLGKEKGREFMKKFAQQDIQFRRGHTLLGQLLTAGEFSLIMTLRDNTAYQFMKKGGPIDWVAIEPVIPSPANAVALPKQPPHPNAARLFIDYILSREGQEVMRSLGRNTTRTDVDPLLERIKNLRYEKIDWPSYIENYKRYEGEFQEIFLKGR